MHVVCRFIGNWTREIHFLGQHKYWSILPGGLVAGSYIMGHLSQARTQDFSQLGGKISRGVRKFFYAPPWLFFAPLPWNYFVQKVNQHHKNTPKRLHFWVLLTLESLKIIPLIEKLT